MVQQFSADVVDFRTNIKVHVETDCPTAMVQALSELAFPARPQYATMSPSARRSGRTQRMLIRALGSEAKWNYVVAHSHQFAEDLFCRFYKLAEDTGSLVGAARNDIAVVGNRTFVFTTQTHRHHPAGAVFTDHHVQETQ